MFTCTVYVAIFFTWKLQLFWTCWKFDMIYNHFFLRVTTNNYVLSVAFYPPSPPLLSSLSHYENKYCKRKSLVNLCTVLTECMHITWTTCSTVTMFKCVCQTLRAARGASNPKKMNEMHRTQFDHACLVRNSLIHNLIKRVLTNTCITSNLM